MLEALAHTLNYLNRGVELQLTHIFIDEFYSQVRAERHRAKTVVHGLAGDAGEVSLPFITVIL